MELHHLRRLCGFHLRRPCNDISVEGLSSNCGSNKLSESWQSRERHRVELVPSVRKRWTYLVCFCFMIGFPGCSKGMRIADPATITEDTLYDGSQEIQAAPQQQEISMTMIETESGPLNDQTGDIQPFRFSDICFSSMNNHFQPCECFSTRYASFSNASMNHSDRTLHLLLFVEDFLFLPK